MPSVLITGANRGIGLEFVRQYAKMNWKVVATCRNPDKADQLNSLVSENADQIKVFFLDILDHSSIDDFAKLIHGEPIDIIINNAGIIGPTREEIAGQSFGSMNYNIWENVFKTKS